ncbi:MAG: hypothetical protein EZS28_008132 [Streblomastix strix]|uniref:Uncharacterized protein n=1 Tax=Streblomastix strix TaxID=222440 RepID=A0A5J4WMQ1_9EUKA|nr:MAG: hypothetical protein EZS28_008132 [Streblomastix strix]
MHELEEVQYLANQMDYTTSLDLKSAFRHITQQLRIQINEFWDSTQSNLLRISNRINSQVNKNTQSNQNTQLLRRHSDNSLGQANTKDKNIRNSEDIGIIQKDNFNRKMRNRTNSDNSVLGMDTGLEREEYRNVGRNEIENDLGTKGLVQHDTLRQKHENKAECSNNRQIKFFQTLDQRSVSIPPVSRQKEDASIENRIMGLDNDSEQGNDQRTEVVNMENMRQLTRLIDLQNNNMLANN